MGTVIFLRDLECGKVNRSVASLGHAYAPVSSHYDSINILKESQIVGKCVFTLRDVAKMLSKVEVSVIL